MFTTYSLFGQFSICPFLFHCQPMQFRVLGWDAAVGMQFVDPQIAAVSQAESISDHYDCTFFEQAKIMRTAIAKSGAQDFFAAQIDRYLGFLRVPLFQPSRSFDRPSLR